MKIKKINYLVILIILSVFLVGCGKNEEKLNPEPDATGTTTIKQSIVDEEFDKSGTGTLRCKTEAEAGEGIDVDLNYVIEYKRGNILELVSIQKVSSTNKESLDLYENAYLNIAKSYEGLKYYDNNIVRDSNSVTYTITINYDKINLKELLAIEGEEDNIVKGGKAKLSLWLDLAEKMGTTCEEV